MVGELYANHIEASPLCIYVDPGHLSQQSTSHKLDSNSNVSLFKIPEAAILFAACPANQVLKKPFFSFLIFCF